MDFSTERGTAADSAVKAAKLGVAAQAMAGDIGQAIATGQLSAGEVSQLQGVLAGLTGNTNLSAAYVANAVDGRENSGYNIMEGTGNFDSSMSVDNIDSTTETNSEKNNIIDYVKLSKDLGEGLVEDGYDIIDVETADQANADWADMGFDKPPIALGTHVFNVKAGNISYSRVFCEGYNHPKSRFIIRTEDIKGLTAQEIYAKYALPRVPNKIVHVEIPENISLEVSIVGPQDFNGIKTYGGDIQYAIKDIELMDEWFINIEDLK